MPIPNPDIANRRNRIRERMLQELGIDISTGASPMGLLTDALMNEIWALSTDFNSGQLQRNPITASGDQLDKIAESYGLQRIVSRPAAASANQENVVITSTRGVLRNHLGQTLQAGTEITDSSGTKVYEIPDNVTIPADAREITVSVVAKTGGNRANVAGGELTTHSLGSNIEVTNRFPISNGIDVETDAALRRRILLKRKGMDISNASSIRSSLMALSDVADVRYINNARGMGTAGFLLIPVGNTVRADTIEAATYIAADSAAAGTFPVILTPNYRQISVEAVLEFSSDATERDRRESPVRAQDIFIDYMEVVPLGGTFNVQDAFRNIISDLYPIVNNIKMVCFKVDGQSVSTNIIRMEPTDLLIPANGNQPIKFYAGGN